MYQLAKAFLKIFFRNYRALFFVLVMQAAIYIIISYLGIDNIIRFNGAGSYQQYLLPGILALSLMQLGIFNSGYAVIEMRRSGTLKRIAVTPLTPMRFLAAHLLARFVMGLMMAVILLLAGAILFDYQIGAGIWLLPFLIFLGLMLFLNFGYIIASLARDYEDAAPATAIINMVFMFLGDVFFPTRFLPPYFGAIADFLPMKPLSSMMRQSLSGEGSVTAGAVVVLLAWLIITTAVAFRVFAKKAYK